MASNQHNTETPMSSLFPNTVNSTTSMSGAAAAASSWAGGGVGGGGGDVHHKHDRLARENADLTDNTNNGSHRQSANNSSNTTVSHDNNINDAASTNRASGGVPSSSSTASVRNLSVHEQADQITAAVTTFRSKKILYFDEDFVRSLERVVEQQKAKIEELEATVSERDSAVSELEQELVGLKATIENLTDGKARAQADAEETKRRIKKKEKESSRALRALSTEQDRVTALQQSEKNLREEMDRAESARTSQLARVTELELQLRDRDKVLAETRGEAGDAAGRLEETARSVRLLEADRDAAKEELQKMAALHGVQMQELRDEIAERDGKVARLEKQCTALESTATSTRSDLTTATKDLAARVDFLEGEVRTRALQIAALEDTAQTLERKNEHLQQSLEETSLSS